jgi:hypothetical protein
VKETDGLTITLDLRGFVKRLPAHAVLGIFPVDPLAVEESMIGNIRHCLIAVMRQRQNFGAGFSLTHRHPLP